MSDDALLVVVHNLSVLEQLAVERYLQSVFGQGSVSRKHGEIFVELPMVDRFEAGFHVGPSLTSLEAEYHHLLQRLNGFCQQLKGTCSAKPEYDDYTFERIIFR